MEPLDTHFWSQLFGNAHPVEIEIGSGTGTFLLPAAQENPATNYFAMEHSHSRAAVLQQLIDERQLHNVRLLCADAGCVVKHVLPPASVAAYHIYFPDPWWKRRHHRRRLFTPEFIRAIAETLQPDGKLYVATDVALVIDLVRKTIAQEARLLLDANASSPRRAQTRFEQKGMARGAAIHDVVYSKRDTELARRTG
jgi:tRNA (guanine-N7-)-methyltransferase